MIKATDMETMYDLGKKMMDALTKAGVRFLSRPGSLLTFHKTDLDWRYIGWSHSGLSATALQNDINTMVLAYYHPAQFTNLLTGTCLSHPAY